MLDLIKRNPYTFILGFVFTLLVLWPILHNLSSENDFDLFMMAAMRFKQHQPLYETSIIHGRYYYYSPLFVTCLQPFLWLHEWQTPADSLFGGYRLSIIIAKAFWSVFNLYIIRYFVIEIREKFKFKTQRTQTWFWALLIFFCYRWLFLNLWHSQLSLFLLWAVYHSFQFERDNIFKQWWSYIVSINVKIIPIFWLGKLGLERKWEDMALVIAGFIMLLFLPVFFGPYDYIVQQTFDWLMRINPLKTQHVLTTGEGGFIDIGSLVVKYFTTERLENEPYVSIANLSIKGVFWVTQLFRLLLVATVFGLYRLVGESRVYQPKFLIFALFAMAVPLVFPHQRDYSLAFLLPAMVYLVYIFNVQLYAMNSILSAFTLVSLIMMGNAIFFELFSYEFREWVIGVRLQGLGALLFFICFGIFIYDYAKDSQEIDLE